jgi:hypothetical protein
MAAKALAHFARKFPGVECDVGRYLGPSGFDGVPLAWEVRLCGSRTLTPIPTPTLAETGHQMENYDYSVERERDAANKAAAASRAAENAARLCQSCGFGSGKDKCALCDK